MSGVQLSAAERAATNVVGKAVRRTDALKKVTGELAYIHDVRLPGMLFAKLLRSEHAHARIVGIELTEAIAVPGVVDILTAARIGSPVPRYGPIKPDQPILADGIVKYHGEPVAVVIAETEEAADRALRLIRIEYEPLASVWTIEDALRPGAPLVNEIDVVERDGRPSNVCGEWDFGWGEVDGAEEGCGLILHRKYQFPMVHHFPIEPYCCIAYPEDGGVTIRSPIQHPFVLRRVVAQALHMELNKVRVMASPIGGGFGAKGYPKVEPLTAYLALRIGRPIKLALTLDEGFFSARRAGATIDIRTGFDAGGLIRFQDIDVRFLIGAYADAAPRVARKSSYLACGAYRTPNARIHCEAVHTNTMASTAYRGFGMPQLIWALESQMNECAVKLGLDPLEIRLRNIPGRGEELVPGDTPVDGIWAQGLRKAADLVGWETPLPANTGRGIAIGIKSPIPSSVSNALVRLHTDGSFAVIVGTTEMGQGARTVMGQLAAETLGVPMQRIVVHMGDTSIAPFDTATAGSRSTVCMGTAVVKACEDVLRQLEDMAHELFSGGERQEVKVGNDAVRGYGRSLAYRELILASYGPNTGEIVGRGMYRGSRIEDHPIGGRADFWEIIFTAAEVKVDRESGKLHVMKLANVSDIGCVINPLQAEAQEEGGAIMGLGHTLMEELVYDESGRLRNGGALDYRILTSMDIPVSFFSSFVENGDGPGPSGSKGLGESGVIAIAPAVAGALYDATGLQLRELPLSQERVWRALRKQQEETADAVASSAS